MTFVAIFSSFFNILVSSVFRGKRKLCHGPILGEFLKKSETDSKGKPFFRDHNVFGMKTRQNRNRSKVKKLFSKITMFLEQKLTKPGQIHTCKFSLSLFDHISFRSNVVSFNCLFD